MSVYDSVVLSNFHQRRASFIDDLVTSAPNGKREVIKLHLTEMIRLVSTTLHNNQSRTTY